MLHILAHSPYADAALFTRLCNTIEAGDTLLLIEDGVLGVCGEAASALGSFQGQVFALAADVEARGLTAKVDPMIGQVDMPGFVRLSAEHATSISWR